MMREVWARPERRRRTGAATRQPSGSPARRTATGLPDPAGSPRAGAGGRRPTRQLGNRLQTAGPCRLARAHPPSIRARPRSRGRTGPKRAGGRASRSSSHPGSACRRRCRLNRPRKRDPLHRRRHGHGRCAVERDQAAP